MYGHIHVILKDLVVSVAGKAAWSSVLKEAGFRGPAAEVRVLDTIAQNDSVTLALVGATCKVLGLEPPQALYVFGKHFVLFALRSGNAFFLKSQGATLKDFLENVNTLHSHLERDHPDSQFPYVDAMYDPVSDTSELTYLSVRTGLKHLLVGVVEEIGNRLYGLEVKMEEVEVPEEMRCAASADRSAAWRVSWRPRPGGPEPVEERTAVPKPPKMLFPQLHSAMVGFVNLCRKADLLEACKCGAKAASVGEPRRTSAGGPRKVAVRMEPEVIASPAGDSNPEGDEDEDRGAVMMTKSDSLRKLREVENNEDGRPLHHILLRATLAQQVAAAWTDAALPRCRQFWESSTGRAEDYALSQDAAHVDVFVSHSWSPPENWNTVMGSEMNYADVKSTTLAVMAKDIAIQRNQLSKWGDVKMWVDKACIPQDIDQLKASCINLIEKFIDQCDHVCVLFTWSYLERLWCVFEWACVLVEKDPRQVVLQNELFVTERTFPLYVEAIRYFSLERTKCLLESDRSLLSKKIDESYTSHRDFEQLVKATATALMARSMAFRAGRAKALGDRFYAPWVTLASELGFGDLAQALATCKPIEWRAEAAPALLESSPSRVPMLLGRRGLVSKGASMGVSARRYHQRIGEWFDHSVSPVLFRIRRQVVRHGG